MSHAKGASTTMKKITKEVVNNIPIPLPDLATQQEIVTHLDALSAHTKDLEEKTDHQIQRLEALKSSLLDQAFRGKL